MVVKFSIPGPVTAKGRHHTVALKRCGSCQRTTTSYQCPSCGNTSLVFLSNVKLADQPTEKYESFVSLCAMNAGIANKTYCGAVKLSAVFKFAIPQSRRKKLKENDPHTQRPDLDNCQKSLLDGLNRVAWSDDSQICAIHAVKRWTAGEPGVEVEIEYADGSAEVASVPQSEPCIPVRTDRELSADTGTSGVKSQNPSPFQNLFKE